MTRTVASRWWCASRASLSKIKWFVLLVGVVIGVYSVSIARRNKVKDINVSVDSAKHVMLS